MSSPQEAQRRSDISCRSCRGRKVRCDRVLPQCSICVKTSQTCSYPPKAQKPGPKIGSLQRQRKRRRRSLEWDLSDPEETPQSRERIWHSSSRQNDLENASSQNDFASNVDKANHAPALEEADDWSTQTREARPDLQNLSFILHPSHETSSPEQDRRCSQPRPPGDMYRSTVFEGAAASLGVTQPSLDLMIRTYFDNMLAISLFHQPTFMEKLNAIESATQLHALLAAMLAYAARFDSNENPIPQGDLSETSDTRKRTAHFLDLAVNYTNQALMDCGDEAPSLCILQAYIITAHCQLTQGVRGRAWRTLGTCVRLAYELNLHLVDMKGTESSTEADAEAWCLKEEKRRAWWAIWEMDVFATTIRRTPPAVAWSQIETLLPVEDVYWFRKQARPSSYFVDDPIYRWRALQQSGNESPKAWYIVINSLMKDAQRISSPRGIQNQSQADRNQPPPSIDHQKSKMIDEARKKLETLANAVQCFVLALPSHLQFRDQFLGFEARLPGQLTSGRQKHCSIYDIHVMTQLARLMIYRYDVFGSHAMKSRVTHNVRNDAPRGGGVSGHGGMDSSASRQYFEAADEVLRIINRSRKDHVQHINPFLAYTIWLASAVQLVRRGLSPPGTDRSLTRSKFEVLHLAYKNCVAFWDIQTAVQRNLEQLEAQVEASQALIEGEEEQSTSLAHIHQPNNATVARRTSCARSSHIPGQNHDPYRPSAPSQSRSAIANETGNPQQNSPPAQLPNSPLSMGQAGPQEMIGMSKDVGSVRGPHEPNSGFVGFFPPGNSNGAASGIAQTSASPSSMPPQLYGDGAHGFHTPQHDFNFDWGRMELFGDLSNIFLDSQPVDFLSQI